LVIKRADLTKISGKGSIRIHRLPKNNLQIQSGDFRGINLEEEPFSKYFKNFELVSQIHWGVNWGSMFIQSASLYRKVEVE
jgi:hypothetical protein